MIKDIKKSVNIMFVLAALGFGLARALSVSLLETDSVAVAPWRFVLFSAMGLLVLYGGLYLIKALHKRTKNKPCSLSSLKLYIVLFIPIFVVYSLFFMAYFPGTAVNDSLMIYRNGMMMANASPPIYCLFIVIFSKLGAILNSARLGLILCNIFQLIVVCAMSAWIAAWVFKNSFPVCVKLLVYLYFLLNPLLIIYSFCMVKDTMFSLGVAVLFLLLWDLLMEETEVKKMNWLLFAVDAVLLASFRNGVLYVLIPFLTVLLFVKKRKYFRSILIILLCVLFTGVFAKVLEKRFDVEYYSKEMMAIPIQQLAATVYNDGELTEEQAEVINNMMKLEIIKEKYNPPIVDPIKWDLEFSNAYVNANVPTILKVWLEVFPNNVEIYTKAYLWETLWFWAPVQDGEVKIFKTVVDIFPEWHEETGIVDTPLLPEGLTNALHSYCEQGSRFLREGVLFWVMVLCLLELYALSGNKWVFMLYAVFLAQWLVLMVSTPVYESIRYVLSYVYALPLFFAMLLKKTDN